MQDVATAGTFVDDLKGKKATVFAQDNAFGQGNLAAVKAALGAKGAMADAILVPEDVTEFTPFARQLIHTKPACRHHEVTAAQGLEPCGPEPSGRTASATLSLSRAPVIAATPDPHEGTMMSTPRPAALALHDVGLQIGGPAPGSAGPFKPPAYLRS